MTMVGADPGELIALAKKVDQDATALTLEPQLAKTTSEQAGWVAFGHGDTVLQIQHQDGTWSWRTTEDQPMVTAPEGEIRQQIARVFGPVLAV